MLISSAAYFFTRYQRTGNLHVDASQSQVAIAKPLNIAQFTAGSVIQVEVNASGQQNFTSTELWINGVLEGVRAAPAGGLSALSTSFSWVPPKAGNYALIARAINKGNITTVTQAMFVFVNPAPFGGQPDLEAGRVSAVVLPPLRGTPTNHLPRPAMFKPQQIHGRDP